MRKSIGFLKTTALGGLIFLLPLIVVVALLGQAVQIVYAVAEPIGKYLPVTSVMGVSLGVAIAVAGLLAVCFLSGLAARRSFARRFSQTIEKKTAVALSALRDSQGPDGGAHWRRGEPTTAETGHGPLRGLLADWLRGGTIGGRPGHRLLAEFPGPMVGHRGIHGGRPRRAVDDWVCGSRGDCGSTGARFGENLAGSIAEDDESSVAITLRVMVRVSGSNYASWINSQPLRHDGPAFSV